MINIPSYIKDPSYRYQMPELKIKVEGKGNGIRTKLLNLFEVSRSLGVPPEYPLRYFGAEFGAIIEFKQSEQKAMLNGGSLRKEDLRTSLDHFIEKFVLCPKCKYPEINIRIKKNELFSDCKACGEFRRMDMTHKICNFILKSPPNGSSKLGPEKKKEPRRTHGKKKGKSLTLKSPEILECLELLSENKDLNRAGEMLTNLTVSKDFEPDIKAYLMFKGIFSNNLITLMSEPAAIQILKSCASGCGEDFMIAFATVYGLEESWKEKIPTAMYHFYNNEILDEEFFENWRNDDLDFNESSPAYNEAALVGVKNNSAQFLEWLKNAEEEEEEEEEGAEEIKTEEERKAEEKVLENSEGGSNSEAKIEEGSGNCEAKVEKAPVENNKNIMSQLKDVEDFNIDDI